MELSKKLTLLRKAIAPGLSPIASPYPAFTLFFSVSDGKERASVVHATGNSFEATWQSGLAVLRAVMRKKGLKGKWLRVDRVDSVEAVSWDRLTELLRSVKRNYFRFGLALDQNLEIAFLEQELNANAMLYGGNKVPHAVLNENNFTLYARRRFGGGVHIDFSAEKAIHILSTSGVFCDADGSLFHLNGRGLDAGRRQVSHLSEGEVRTLIESASGFLARQVGPDGAFVYGYHPCFDRKIDAYNTLRHASTTYAMIEAWEITRDPSLKVSIDRSLDYLSTQCIHSAQTADGVTASFLVEVGDEIKLGGNAVAILAFSKYAAVTGTRQWHDLLERLALGIGQMFNPKDGTFSHVLNCPDLSVKQAFRTIYYEGEAAFALMRLYSLTGDERWLRMVEEAFENFIRNDYWKHHDHWLSYAVNELTRYRPDERYFQFGLRNISDHLDFVLQRITTFPTLLELMMASHEMLERIGDDPKLRHLLFSQIDLPKFYRALEYRAHYLLNGYFWPELAMYFGNPNQIVGSFFIRHHAFRVRIDDVEHYLSGFIAYLKYRQGGPRAHLIPFSPADDGAGEVEAGATVKTVVHWTKEQLCEATGGRWTVPPGPGWLATGVCIHAPAMQPGNLVVVRSGEEGSRGIAAHLIRTMGERPRAIITSAPQDVEDMGLPILQVEDTGKAILNLGRFARRQMTGKVLAVTGSAGKTSTVAMLAQALTTWGPVGQTSFNANLPHGVAWNLASMPWEVPHIVIELAIGRMRQSAVLARPDVAIFTNVLPAHLGEKASLADIARTKSQIFLGMPAGGVAILNRDMLEWETVFNAAEAHGLRVVHYGRNEESEFRLIGYDPAGKSVCAEIRGKPIEFRIGAGGEHMAMNSLATLAAIEALGHPFRDALPELALFRPLPGRGAEFGITYRGRRLHVIDQAYNANPGSMSAALLQLSQKESAPRRIAVLGEMAELGPQAAGYHESLAGQACVERIDRFYVMGDLYAGFWEKIPSSRRGRFVRSLDELKGALGEELADGDVVLFKGSHSTRIHQLVSAIREDAAGGDGGGDAGLAGRGGAEWSLPPHLGVVLYDGGQQRPVFSQNERKKFRPASITKLLSLALVEERRKTLGILPDTLVDISEKAARVNSRWGFNAGDRVPMATLMRAAAIVSSNEAAHALSEWHSGTTERFTDILNARATTIGLRDTRFASPSGLGAGQSTTVEDVLLLARYIHACHPEIAAICKERFFVRNGKRHANTNRLLAEIEGAEGLKTGSLVGHGFHLVFSAMRNDRRLIAVVLGAATKDERDNAVRVLFERCDKL